MLSYIGSQSDYLNMFLAGIAYILAIMISIMTHEVAHGFVALKAGDPTAKEAGRLNFNPVKHFNIFGLLMFVFAGIGWANPVPINPYYFKNYKKDMLLVSVAGVISNFLMAFVSFGILAAVEAGLSGVYPSSQVGYRLTFFFVQFLFIMVLINISLMAFNLIPIYPLDGFRVMETLAGRNNGYCTFMRKYGIYIFLAIVLIGNIFPLLNVFGYYMGFVRKIIIKLFSLIFGSNILG